MIRRLLESIATPIIIVTLWMFAEKYLQDFEFMVGVIVGALWVLYKSEVSHD